MNSLDAHSPLNEDFTPISYHRQLLYWLSQFQSSYWALAGAGAVVLVFLAGRMNAITFGILTGGFAASSVEVLLLISFQIIYGYVYFLTGVIISIFMAGLGLGAAAGSRDLRHRDIYSFILVQSSIACAALISPAVLGFVNSRSDNTLLVHAVFVVAAFTFALFIGAEFALASRLQNGSVSTIASNLYSVDLAGSAVGALLVTAYLVPLLGIAKVFYIAGALTLFSVGVTIAGRKKYLTTG